MNPDMMNKISEQMISHHLTLATAESCTGGLLAHMLTNISGSSSFFEQGIVSYSNRSKSQLLDVSETLIQNKGAVSAEVAEAMAIGIRNLSHADFGLATTGIAGPTGGTKKKPVGLVYIALATSKQTIVQKHLFKGDRLENKQLTCEAILCLLLHHLESR